jgi:hypothetical protein
MANYLLAYSGGPGMPKDEKARQTVMAAWGKWFETLGSAKVDGGNPFGPSKTITKGGNVKDGNISHLGGYSIIKADNMDAALKLAKGCPILHEGGTVEVYENINAM